MVSDKTPSCEMCYGDRLEACERIFQDQVYIAGLTEYALTDAAIGSVEVVSIADALEVGAMFAQSHLARAIMVLGEKGCTLTEQQIEIKLAGKLEDK